MITVTGNLTDDPRTFQTRDNATGCELRVAVNLPSRTGTGNDITRYLKVVTFGVLAIHAAESVRNGGRVTIQGHDHPARRRPAGPGRRRPPQRRHHRRLTRATGLAGAPAPASVRHGGPAGSPAEIAALVAAFLMVGGGDPAWP